ncbi:DUF6371 domain-containing protein [Spirosoma jeollabukense]
MNNVLMNKPSKLFTMNKVSHIFSPPKSPNLQELADQLEEECGTAILEELTGQTLTHKSQPVRLFDQTARTAEAYYPADENEKPYIQNHQEGKRWYPVTAWMAAYNVDWKTAVQDLTKRYLGAASFSGKRAVRSGPSIGSAKKLPASYHDPAFVAETQTGYERNNFAIYLRRLLGVPVADELLARFRVGTWPGGVAKEWQRCTVFWQIDEQERVHAGKILYYSPGGKRMKEKNHDFSQPAWAHRLIGLTGFHLEQTLFGLHQLRDQSETKPIAIVESEKTAIVCTAFEPGFIWLACGGLSNLNAEKCKPLAGRPIVLFPDLGGLALWTKKADELRRLGYTVSVSQILEKQATRLERRAGWDLADYLTQHRCDDTGRVLNEPDGYPALWDCESLNPLPTIKVLSLTDYLNQA